MNLDEAYKVKTIDTKAGHTCSYSATFYKHSQEKIS